MKQRVLVQALVAVMIFMFVLGVSSPGQAADKKILMATTTSTDNTGLLDYLAPKFTAATGIELQWVATGTGKALKLGENCDADVLLVHAPAAEKKYVQTGYGINRRQIMYNDLVIIGPSSDPANIKGKNAIAALVAIQSAQALFMSRGDNSGTNKKEIALWKLTSIQRPEKESWYIQTGQSMLTTITVAAERNGYTLTDRGTYIKYEADHHGAPALVILAEKDPLLLNQYSVLEVNPARCPQVKNNLAKAVSVWLAGAEAQTAINEFKLMGRQLFVPNADSE
jgi:tungstate transport system substrate-binding protein